MAGGGRVAGIYSRHGSRAAERVSSSHALRPLTEPLLIGAAETPYLRRPSEELRTDGLLADAFLEALEAAGVRRSEVDGLAVSSFTLAPDTVIDLAWKLGVRARWIMQSPLGGASGLDMLQHAIRAIESGDASTVVILSGDRFSKQAFAKLVSEYNRVTHELLDPLPFLGPPSVFSMLTQRYMDMHGLTRADFAQIPIAQRGWAAGNPNAAYRDPLTLDQYLSAPMVADPLCIYDCVPVTSGADAIVLSTHTRPGGGSGVRVRALAALHNPDNQAGDGLKTGLAEISPGLWQSAGRGPAEMDVISVYDDFPVMVLVQMVDLGLIGPDQVRPFLNEQLPAGRPVNTAGGMLSAGQSGASGGLHGIVECVRQLQGRAGARQVQGARHAVVAGYGMVLYRFGACANAAVMEAVA